jgi:hypothetical protein
MSTNCGLVPALHMGMFILVAGDFLFDKGKSALMCKHWVVENEEHGYKSIKTLETRVRIQALELYQTGFGSSSTTYYHVGLPASHLPFRVTVFPSIKRAHNSLSS